MSLEGKYFRDSLDMKKAVETVNEKKQEVEINPKYFGNNLDMKRGMEVEREKKVFLTLKKQQDEINLKYDELIKTLQSLSQSEGDLKLLIDRFEAKRKEELKSISYGQSKHKDEPESVTSDKVDNKEESKFLKELKNSVVGQEILRMSPTERDKISKEKIDIEEVKRRFNEL